MKYRMNTKAKENDLTRETENSLNLQVTIVSMNIVPLDPLLELLNSQKTVG